MKIKEEKKMLKNQKGFTLIEIIAVLVILGILAAVAVPKYLDLAADAKAKAALAQIAEMKGTLNLAYAQRFISTGIKPTDVANVISTATIGTSMGTAPDIWAVTVTASGSSAANLTVSDRNGDAGYAATGTWNMP
jgi:MSHA pilin protein MshA